MRILHISEAYGGGIVTAVRSFVENSPQHEHHLLASIRPAEAMALDKEAVFGTVSDLPRSLFKAWMTINAVYRRLRPDFVHLHSSYAGVYGRLALIPKRKIIYSPHGFSFERLDFSGRARLAFGLIESTLALRTGRFAGVSRYEVKRAQAFPGGAGGYLLPNTWGSTVKPYDGGLCRTTPAVVGMKARIAFVGRLAPQKDPGFLLGALGLLADSGVPPQDHFDITWYGGGDDEVKIKLESFGVRVTGWMPHAEVMQGLRNSTLYVHTGAWEGFPMSVIEAAVAGCPLLLRSINAFDDYGFPTRSMFHAPRELAEVLVNWSKGVPDLLAAAESAKDVVLAACSPTSQRGALLSLYASAEREPAMALGRHRQ